MRRRDRNGRARSLVRLRTDAGPAHGERGTTDAPPTGDAPTLTTDGTRTLTGTTGAILCDECGSIDAKWRHAIEARRARRYPCRVFKVTETIGCLIFGALLIFMGLI